MAHKAIVSSDNYCITISKSNAGIVIRDTDSDQEICWPEHEFNDLIQFLKEIQGEKNGTRN